MGNSSGDETYSPMIRVYDAAGNVIETHEHADELTLFGPIDVSDGGRKIGRYYLFLGQRE